MSEFDPIVSGILDRYVERRDAATGDWANVLQRAHASSSRSRLLTRRRAVVAAIAVMALTASAAEAGVLQRAARAFTDLLSPASPKATQVIASAGRRFSLELQTMGRELPHKVTGSAPVLRLGPARQVSTLPTPLGRVAWDAAVDRHGRGYCQVAVRHNRSLGGDCQVTDERGFALSVATSGDTSRLVIITGLVPRSAAKVVIARPSHPSAQARRIGRFFFATVPEGSPLTVTVTADDGHVLRKAAFTDPVCTNGVDPRGLRLLAGLGFTYCGQGGVIGRFPANPEFAPVCAASGCGTPTIRNNEQPMPAAAPSTAKALLRQLRENLGTALIEDARLGAPPDGYGKGGHWLYVRIAAAHGVEGALADFYALLLAGAYGREAPLGHLPPLGGLTYYDARTPGCGRSADDPTCSGVSWRAHLQIGAGGRTDAATVESEIRLALARLGLVPVSIKLVRPLDSLAAIVVARTDRPAGLNLARLADQVFGSNPGLEGTYLEILDHDGHPLAAQAAEDSLGIGIGWAAHKPRG